MKKAFKLVPKAVTAMIITNAIKAASSPYSIAIAPSSSFKNFNSLFILSHLLPFKNDASASCCAKYRIYHLPPSP